jgi:4-amino-4-deoxy-L-arabinose transferase-like glycosyltransferase
LTWRIPAAYTEIFGASVEQNSDLATSVAQGGRQAQATAAKIIKQQLSPAKHQKLAVAALLALCGLGFFFGLGRLALAGPDEPRYAEVAREMLVSGDLISPRLGGCLWFEKPALLYWMAAAAYRIFGVSEFAARIPSAAMATAAVLFLYMAIAQTLSARLALIVGLVLTTSALFIGYARAAVPDMPLAASISIALIAAYLATVSRAMCNTYPRLSYWALSAAATGLAVLAKGLVGIVLVIAIIAITYGITGRANFIGWRQWLLALLIFLVVSSAVASTWYVPVTIRHGTEFIEEFFINHHFKRYLTDRYHHPQPVYFFPVIAIAGIVPWTFFLIPALERLLRLKPVSLLLALAWVWLVVPVVFFSFSESKLPGYILPALPALAIIIGAEVERAWAGERTLALDLAKWLTAGLIVFLGAAFIIYCNREAGQISGLKKVIVWLPLTLAIAAAALTRLAARALIVGTAATMLGIIIGALLILPAHLDEKISLKELSLKAAAALEPGERVAFYLNKEYAPVFYCQGRIVCGVGEGDVLNAYSTDELASALAKETSLIVFTLSRWEDDLCRSERFQAELIGRQGEAVAFRLSLAR